MTTMSEGEKMIWAAAFVQHVVHSKASGETMEQLFNAAKSATSTVTCLRFAQEAFAEAHPNMRGLSLETNAWLNEMVTK